jgi:hypothetical protein
MAALSLSSNVPALTPFVYRSLDTLTLKRVSRMSPLILRSEIVSPVATFRQRFDLPGSFSKAPCGVTRIFRGRGAPAMGQKPHALSGWRIARMHRQRSAWASRTIAVGAISARGVSMTAKQVKAKTIAAKAELSKPCATSDFLLLAFIWLAFQSGHCALVGRVIWENVKPARRHRAGLILSGGSISLHQLRFRLDGRAFRSSRSSLSSNVVDHETTHDRAE